MWATGAIQGGCLAVALFSVHKGAANFYFPPVGEGNSREEAVSGAVAECERYVGLENDRVEACRVASSPRGVPGVACVEDFGGGTVETAASPGGSPAEWGSLAFGIAVDDVWDAYASAEAWAWAFGSGDSAAAAERAADGKCESLLGGHCGEYLDSFANACAAIAVSACPSGCSWPAHGIGGGSSEREASREAIAECERGASGRDVGGTCRVATSDQGEPGVVCVGDAR